MKKVIVFLAALLGALSYAAEPVFVTVDGAKLPAVRIQYSIDKTVTGPLVFGGLGDTKDPAWSGKVVIFDRGVIFVAAKVANAEQSGALGVVIANDDSLNEPTLGQGNGATIPALFVSKANGATLKTRAGAVARAGTAAPPKAPDLLPDPALFKDKWLFSDGVKWSGAALPEMGPQSRMESEVELGKRLAFGVQASGTPPFTYQWIKDGANIPGATAAQFVKASATPEDAGTYVCQVSNPAGTAPSGAHVITIKTP
jgi:hypothetical protein